ncbi:recombination regulator RecX [Clostridium neonatale]|uniref:Regulatory protein RecX n=1 Tax=Clostridium neonatale TaxID=137838 RepID=A0A2A7MGD9_9CLOT|nr:recombination regulator RecX [Clostridium neonatale]PEG28198.1 recombination regulator RecX [Clostridium neonatale]PEG30669.1 recombination regulator RecX [Clostridium neonatale]CAI3245201.1 putative regulatory protein RecX [Clostridium neonatale]CAI3572525.1 putative regulatory protein RecX [Clostridium neonatale]
MPKITKIEIQKNNKDRVNIYLDGEYALAINAELVYKENLKVKDDVDISKLQEIAEKESYIRCKESAIKIIERSYKTEKEIRDKLKQKGYEEKQINNSIDFLKEYNFINDNTYAKAFIKDKLSSKGSQKIKYDLMKKGIAKDIIEENLIKVDKNEEKEVALNVGRKKYESIRRKESDNYKLSGKLYRFLISRGYAYDIVKDVVKEIMSLDEFE